MNNKKEILKQLQIKIDDYINQFDYEITNDVIPTKKGYMQHMGITDDDLKNSGDKSYLLNRGLTKVAVFLEKGLYMKDSKKLTNVMNELVNSFGYHH